MNLFDLGFPPKFSNWREGQEDAVIDAAMSLLHGKRFYVSAQPTGAGKSVFYVAVSRLLESKRTLILTATKALEAQLMREFGAMGLIEIKGQNNYRCLAVARPDGRGAGGLYGQAPEKSGCDDGPCHAGVECSLRHRGCFYFDQVSRARQSSLVVTNYDYWMFTRKFGDEPIGVFDLLVMDEAHSAPDKLAEFVSIYLGKEELLLINAYLPPLDAGLDYWAEWAKERLTEATAVLESAKKDKASARSIRELRNLSSKLKDLSEAAKWKRGNPGSPDVWMPGASTDWVAEGSHTGATFSPVWAHGYAEKFLFAEIPRVVLTSATIALKTVGYLGLSTADSEFNEQKSIFSKERRPVYLIGNIRVKKSMSRGEELTWMNKIDTIIAGRLDRKIIIHAVSYDRAKFIHEHSRYGKHMIVHSRLTTQDQVERFRRMSAPAILVSPSVREGWDFPYSDCEVQIIVKIPFVDMRPAIIQARHKQDKHYTDYLAIMALVQSAGRGMRAEDDLCETFICDANIGWLMARNREVFPKWFRAAIKRVDAVPLALKRIRRIM